MKKIELYSTWFDHHGNPYPPGVYVAEALPKRALEIDELVGKVFDSNDKESLEKVDVKTKSNSTITEIEHKTTKRQTKTKTANKKPKTQNLTPTENHPTKIESNQTKSSE